jgi:hypothetical protein
MDDNSQGRYRAAVDLAASVWAEGKDWDSVPGVLRRNGFEMGESHKATVTVLSVDAPTAFRLAVDSPVWADLRQATIEANEGLAQELRQVADEWQEDERKPSATPITGYAPITRATENRAERHLGERFLRSGFSSLARQPPRSRSDCHDGWSTR